MGATWVNSRARTTRSTPQTSVLPELITKPLARKHCLSIQNPALKETGPRTAPPSKNPSGRAHCPSCRAFCLKFWLGYSHVACVGLLTQPQSWVIQIPAFQAKCQAITQPQLASTTSSALLLLQDHTPPSYEAPVVSEVFSAPDCVLLNRKCTYTCACALNCHVKVDFTSSSDVCYKTDPLQIGVQTHT